MWKKFGRHSDFTRILTAVNTFENVSIYSYVGSDLRLKNSSQSYRKVVSRWGGRIEKVFSAVLTILE
jgi:hypothetical protein